MRNLLVPSAVCAALALAVSASAGAAEVSRAYVSVPAAEGAAIAERAPGDDVATVEVDRFVAVDPATMAPAPAVTCPTGATCFLQAGKFYTPSEREPMRIYKLLVPTGQRFRRSETTFKFRLTQWNAEPRGIFTLIYLNRNGKFRSNTLAVVDIAKEQRRVHVETTLGLPNVGPPAGVQNERQKVLLTAGETYDVKYVYDAENLLFHLTMIDSKGKKVVDLEEPLISETATIQSRGSFWIQFSEPFGESLHVPSIGWEHSDLVFALIK